MKPWFYFEKEKQRNECSPLTLERKAIWSLLRRHAGAKNRFDFVSSSRTKFCEAFFDSLKAQFLRIGLSLLHFQRNYFTGKADFTHLRQIPPIFVANQFRRMHFSFDF